MEKQPQEGNRTDTKPRKAQDSPKANRKKACGPGIQAPNNKAKNFVLDTNVLLHDPTALCRFEDNHVCLPADVLAELDKFKTEQTERGANSRKVHRNLSAKFAKSQGTTALTPSGGSVRLVIYDPSLFAKDSPILAEFRQIFPDQDKIDHRILGACLLIAEQNENPVVLVTKDINMQLKARALGIDCEDYQNDKVDKKEITTNKIVRVEVTSHDLTKFASSGELPAGEKSETLEANQYVLLTVGEKQTIPARHTAQGVFVKLNCPDLKIPDGQSLKPLNLGQRCLIDALLNPDISLVTCYGHAGTGKTLVAVAAGLHAMFSRQYSGITVSRPVVAMGEQMGFLPGSIEEKMHPWLQPIHDALEFLMRTPTPQGARRKQDKKTTGVPAKKPYETLLEQGILEIEALCYIRGRSIPNRFFILDEAQQLTPQEAKTIVTRMSKDSKLVLVGDPAQIDNPYVDSRSNGLVYTRNRLRNQAFTAHIGLDRGERSELAEAGAQLM